MASTSNNNILTKICERLGINDTNVTRKSQEYLRLFQSKGGLKTLNDYAKTVMCVDLASSYSGIAFDKETAIKLSGLKKSTYQTNLHSVEKLLEVDRVMTVGELCVQLGCTSLKDLAGQILNNYKERDAIGKDYTHPQYVAAAVYAACRIKKIKIEKSQFVSMSRLKPSQWKEIETEFCHFAETAGFGKDAKHGSKRNDLCANVDNLANEKENEQGTKRKQRDEHVEEIEEYEVWKNRVLEEARRAIVNKN